MQCSPTWGPLNATECWRLDHLTAGGDSIGSSYDWPEREPSLPGWVPHGGWAPVPLRMSFVPDNPEISRFNYRSFFFKQVLCPRKYIRVITMVKNHNGCFNIVHRITFKIKADHVTFLLKPHWLSTFFRTESQTFIMAPSMVSPQTCVQPHSFLQLILKACSCLRPWDTRPLWHRIPFPQIFLDISPSLYLVATQMTLLWKGFLDCN